MEDPALFVWLIVVEWRAYSGVDLKPQAPP